MAAGAAIDSIVCHELLLFESPRRGLPQGFGQMNKNLVRQIFELRFPPLIGFFDRQSALLDALYSDRKTKRKNFEHWQLGSNRIDVFDADQKRAFFFSFQNCGFSCGDPPTANYLRDQLQKYLRLSLQALGDPLEEILRVGFRETTIVPVEDFNRLRDTLVEVFLRTDNAFFTSLGAPIADLHFPIVFKRGSDSFKITLGPAQKNELEATWGKDSGLPERALYLDVDYYTTEPQTTPDPVTHATNFITKAQAMQNKILTELIAVALAEPQ